MKYRFDHEGAMMYTDYLNLVQLAGAVNLPKIYLSRLADANKIPFLMVQKGCRKFQEKDVREALTIISQKELK